MRVRTSLPTGDWLTCRIAEMACYDKALTVVEIEALDAYLVGKYHLPKWTPGPARLRPIPVNQPDS